jgi:transcriptional regulator NrdR family protein
MVCPYCHIPHNQKVIESRKRPSYNWRRLQCLSCKQRFSTHERVATRTEMKALKQGSRTGHAGFRLLAEQMATLWENQAMMVGMIRRVMRAMGVDDRPPLPKSLQAPETKRGARARSRGQ